MNLIFITTVDLSGTSGQNIATAHTVAALARNPLVDLTLICPEPANDLPIEFETLLKDLHFLPRKDARSVAWHIRGQFRMYQILSRIAPQVKEGVIVTRLSSSMLVPPLWAKRWGIPYILLIRGLLGSVVLAQSGRFPGLYRISQFISKMNARTASEVFVAYPEVKQWIDRFRIANQEPSQILYNAVDPDLFQPMPIITARKKLDLGLRSSDFVVGFVGSLRERHGLTDLVQGFSAFKQKCGPAKLMIVGDGPLLPDLEDLTERQKIRKDVIFTGYISHSNVSVYMSACNILYGVVVNDDPSMASNPIKCYEYLACERPIVTTKTPAFKFVQEERLGVLLNSLSPSEVTRALETLYRERESHKAMGRRGRQYVIRNHTWARFAEAIVNVAKSLMGSEAPTSSQQESSVELIDKE